MQFCKFCILMSLPLGSKTHVLKALWKSCMFPKITLASTKLHIFLVLLFQWKYSAKMRNESSFLCYDHHLQRRSHTQFTQYALAQNLLIVVRRIQAETICQQRDCISKVIWSYSTLIGLPSCKESVFTNTLPCRWTLEDYPAKYRCNSGLHVLTWSIYHGVTVTKNTRE